MLAIVALALIAAWTGLLVPADNSLRDVRFAAQVLKTSGGIVFADIDAKSLAEPGVWPWPRKLHAELLDKLMALGATDVAMDIDFSAASDEANDAALQAALERAGGYAHLAAFRQINSETGAETYNLPLKRFLAYADPVIVNVAVDRSGLVRSYPLSGVLNGQTYPSLGAMLAQVEGPPNASFLIDYSIRAASVDHIPVSDILHDRVSAERIAGRQVVIGTSALELRDIFFVPHQGALPGGLLQIVAAETLKQGRMLTPLGPLPGAALIVLLAALMLGFGHRLSLPRAVLSVVLIALLTEVAALWLQTRSALLFDTAGVHFSLIGFALLAVAGELKQRGFLHKIASRERDSTRGILDRVISDNFDGIVIVDQNFKVSVASRAAEDLLGANLAGQDGWQVLPVDLADTIRHVFDTAKSNPIRSEMVLSASSKGQRRIEYAVTLSTLGGDQADGRLERVACLTFRDITERRASEDRLRYLASHDVLTGALSRAQLIELLNERLASQAWRETGVTIIMVDLARFKTVNDTLGHSYGDLVLQAVVSRLKSCGADAVARLGGDSFVLALNRSLSEAAMQQFAGTMLSRVSAPYELKGGHQAIISARAGIADTTASEYDPETLLSHADLALSTAKEHAGSSFKVFVPEMDERLKEKQDMEAALREAVEKNQLSILYQPQVWLESGELMGVEALVRWLHPVLGAVSPAKFIPAGEETGQIIEIGRWVLHKACSEAVAWPDHLRLSVNVSPIQFELTDVVTDVRAALANSGLPPHRLEIEITEGIFVSNARYITETLQALRDIGVSVALDDFGTGYSSLSYLGRLPVDKIKIDQSFVKRLPADQEAGAIIRAVMTLSETLGKVVIAEGIETADQAWMLRMMGCRIGQGYYFGRPCSVEEMQNSFVATVPGNEASVR